jgi:hypothetical protein
MSKRTKLNRDENYSRRCQRALEDTTPWQTSRGYQVGPPGPASMLPSLPWWPLPVSFQKLPPPPPKIASTPSSSRFDPRAHVAPQGYIAKPYPLEETSTSAISQD